tara:strand:- start:61 stop:987 length:927 start_codon:yes stop_codon:yes gene_type:complete
MKYLGLATVFLLFSGHVLGSDSSLDEGTYSLVNSGISYSLVGDSANGTAVTTVDGKAVYVGLTAWSDTGYYNSEMDSYTSWFHRDENDNLVRDQGTPQRWSYTNSDKKGYGIINKDSTAMPTTGYFDTSTYGDAHAIDNRRTGEQGKQDFDMVLLSFSEEVTLTSGSFSSRYRYNGQSRKEVSVIGLDDINKFKNGGNFTWSDIASTSAIEAATGHFAVGSKVDNYYQSEFTGLSAAKYWLVGAYNTIFDPGASQESDFGFKLSALGFSIDNTPDTPTKPPTEVSEPGALALMSLGLGLVLYRRKRRV